MNQIINGERGNRLVCSMEKGTGTVPPFRDGTDDGTGTAGRLLPEMGKRRNAGLAGDRENPIHNLTAFPTRWENRQEPDVLRGSARPGEYYMFQAVVYRETAAGPISLRWAGDEPAPHCFNLSGTYTYIYSMEAFYKGSCAGAGKTRVLWFGVDFSEEFRGEYAGTLSYSCRVWSRLNLWCRSLLPGSL